MGYFGNFFETVTVAPVLLYDAAIKSTEDDRNRIDVKNKEKNTPLLDGAEILCSLHSKPIPPEAFEWKYWSQP